MNYIPEIAKMLGVEIGEEFKLKPYDRNEVTFSAYLFKRDGLYTPYVKDNDLLAELLFGKYEIVKLPKPILTDKEKKYLSLIIEPWKNEIKYMVKIDCDDMEYIMIVFDDLIEMPFPHFKKGKYYKGMEWDKDYSLEELGL